MPPEKEEWGRVIFEGEVNITASKRITIPAEVRKRENIGEDEEYFVIAQTETGRVVERARTMNSRNNYRLWLNGAVADAFSEGDTAEVTIRQIKQPSSAMEF